MISTGGVTAALIHHSCLDHLPKPAPTLLTKCQPPQRTDGASLLLLAWLAASALLEAVMTVWV
jgi:hypothetical protein